jgi:hypothetical protein|tara:strand:+ start:652 stop:912 length:261 start_codon:yes stop_codon:yes gene_type:complete
MSEDKLRGEMDRGAKAKALLNNPMLKEAFEQLEKQYIEAWKISPNRDSEGRERIYLLMKSLDAVHAHLVSVLETGKLAEKQLNLKF